MSYKKLLGVANAKTSKGEDLNYLTGIVYLAPADIVEGVNLCPFASKGCKSACLYSAGRGKFSNVQAARVAKTVLFRDNLNYFMWSLIKDIQALVRKAKRKGLTPCVRLNGTSDIRWENVRHRGGKNIFELFPNVQLYDYTKDFKRVDALKGRWGNYHLTFSMSEARANQRQAWKLLEQGVNVAMVFRSELPSSHNGYDVIDGDKHDLRFLDKRGVIVGLKAKGDAKKDSSGFVQDAVTIELNEAA